MIIIICMFLMYLKYLRFYKLFNVWYEMKKCKVNILKVGIVIIKVVTVFNIDFNIIYWWL